MSEFLTEEAEKFGNITPIRARKSRDPRLRTETFKFSWEGFWHGYWNPNMLTWRAKQHMGAEIYWLNVRKVWYENIPLLFRLPIWFYTRGLWIIWAFAQIARELCFRTPSVRIQKKAKLIGKKWQWPNSY